MKLLLLGSGTRAVLWLVLFLLCLISYMGLRPFELQGQQQNPNQLSQNNQNDQFVQLFKDFLEEEFRTRPLEATRLGEHRFNAFLDDVSPKARTGWIKRYRQTLDKLEKKIDPTGLTRSQQIDREILAHHLGYQLWLSDNTRPFAEDPRTYNDYITESTYLLLTQSTRPRDENVRNVNARVAQLASVVENAKKSLKNPPRVFVETAIKQNRGAIAYYESGIYELAGATPALGELRPTAQRAVKVLREYQTFLEKDLLPQARGEWRLGKEKFHEKLKWELNAGLDADTVFKLAKEEFARVQQEMYVVARQLWSQTHSGLALPVDDAKGRRETIRRVLSVLAREHGKAEDLVRDAQAISERIKTFLGKKDLMRLPQPDRCRIVEMPEFQRGNTIAYLNPAPPLDPKASSFYAISPPLRDWDARRRQSFLEEYNRYMLQLLTIHEAYPGHYVQLEYSNRHPSLVRRVLQSGVFAEGWAVYTEQMMLDQGFGEGDLALRLHQLKWYLRAVANAILDHLMHCTNMTDEEALQFLMEEAYQAEGEAVAKVIRAKQSSAQLSTYFVGRMAFYRLRQEVQRELGDKFHLGRFHEAVLDHGTLPVKYLPELVRERLKQPR